MKSPITTHVLDTATGRPAAGVPVRLYMEEVTDQWLLLASGITDDDGRISDLLPGDHQLKPGRYRMRFSVGDYFREAGTEAFYPYADVVFLAGDRSGHLHIPLLLSPYGYTTYRGN